MCDFCRWTRGLAPHNFELRLHVFNAERHARPGTDRTRKIGMTNTSDTRPPAVGVYWIDEGDYAALLRIFDDGNKMPRTWKEWLKIAEEMEHGLKAYGHVVLRVRIDPNTFPDWCAAQGAKSSSEGRKKLIAAAVYDRFGEQN